MENVILSGARSNGLCSTFYRQSLPGREGAPPRAKNNISPSGATTQFSRLPPFLLSRDGEPFPLDKFSFVIKVNLIGTFNMLSRAAAEMSKNEPLDDDGGRGAIVNLASAAAFDGQIGQCAYSASKAGVVGMALPIARDLAAVGVRVNTVAPGLIDTPIYGEGPESEAFKAHLGKSVLFPKRLGSAEELAFAVMDCITNPYMNAEVIRLDGGIRMPPK